ncbi:class I lanthipeptide [Taibaiella helva]|uniref:class I lanthipeptide n=1 Tax=Taibaiella helva TaxID=2301235 RepID=UPI001300A4B8|nr:class I lanthipeptide [Taibaiella helva]
MKKRIVKSKLSLDKKTIIALNGKKAQAVVGGVNSLEYATRCCCDQQAVIE